jgi:hypothetical protein
MSNEPGTEVASRSPSTGAGGVGCLAGLATAIAIPTIVFVGILIANARNPVCGTPADSGGCEMGLASGTIGAIAIGLGLGIAVAIATTIAIRVSRR